MCGTVVGNLLKRYSATMVPKTASPKYSNRSLFKVPQIGSLVDAERCINAIL
jgi:hypothetical protein